MAKINREFVLRIKPNKSPMHTHTLGHRAIQFKAGIAVVHNADDHLIEEILKKEGSMWDILKGKPKKVILTGADQVKVAKLAAAQKKAEADTKIAEDRKLATEDLERKKFEARKANEPAVVVTDPDEDTEKAGMLEDIKDRFSKTEMMEQLDAKNIEYDKKANKTILAELMYEHCI